MDENAIQLLAKAATEATEKAMAIIAAADAEKRSLTASENEEIQGHYKEAGRLGDEIETRRKAQETAERVAALTSVSNGRKTEDLQPSETPAQLAPSKRSKASDDEEKAGWTVGINRQTLHSKGGYLSYGDYLGDIVKAGIGKNSGNVPPRLKALAAATTYGNETSGSDGGFAVPPDFRNEILKQVMGEDSLLSRCTQYTVAGNSIKIPSDQTAPWGTSGLQAYWTGEAAAITQSKPVLKDIEINLHKLAMLVPVTEELLSDSTALASWVAGKAPEVFTSKINHAILQGDGAGKPLGILSSGAVVSVAKVTAPAQAADTVIAENIWSMYSRMYAPHRPKAIWICHQSCEASFYGFMTRIANTAGDNWVGGGFPLYMPPGGMSQSPYGTLMGRPVFSSQACETVGDQGDIFFADLSAYAVALKSGGVNQSSSMHLWFDQDLMALKFSFRFGGQPMWSTTISPRDGSLTLSPFVTLDERG